jgi:hypothetical protein
MASLDAAAPSDLLREAERGRAGMVGAPEGLILEGESVIARQGSPGNRNPQSGQLVLDRTPRATGVRRTSLSSPLMDSPRHV